jgi:DNA-binding MarR family transcriptional regulator
MGRRKGAARLGGPARQESFQEWLLYWTGLLEARCNQLFIEAMRPVRVTIARFRTLAVLNELTDLSVGELARHTSVERSALGRLLEQMEAEGLVRRQEKSADRRVLELNITPRGREELRKMLPVRRAIRDRALRDIPHAEIAHMVELMQRMLDNLDAAPSRARRSGFVAIAAPSLRRG